MARTNIGGAIVLAIVHSHSDQLVPRVAPSVERPNKGAYQGKGQRKANRANRWR